MRKTTPEHEEAESLSPRVQHALKNVLNYCRLTGVFTWKVDFDEYEAGQIAGSFSDDGYVRISIAGKSYPAQRLAWLYHYGYYPKLVDHINGDPYDNRISNLRICTVQQNCCNKKKYEGTQSGYTGVYPAGDGWIARIGVKGKRINLGTFSSKERASQAYRAAAMQYHDEFAGFYSRECLSSFTRPRLHGEAKRLAEAASALREKKLCAKLTSSGARQRKRNLRESGETVKQMRDRLLRMRNLVA